MLWRVIGLQRFKIERDSFCAVRFVFWRADAKKADGTDVRFEIDLGAAELRFPLWGRCPG
jgi:hypothetical protein